MIEQFSTKLLIIIFLLAASIVWYTGINITKAVNIIDRRFKLGQALGGIIFLAIITNLPEIAIIISASIMKNIELAIGNILGGIAFQTVILSLLDLSVLKNKAPLTYKSDSIQLVIEGTILIIILSLTIIGAQLPKSLIFFRLAPCDVGIIISWFVGLWLIKASRTNIPFEIKSNRKNKDASVKEQVKDSKTNIYFVLFFLIFLSLLILTAGVALEESSRILAVKFGFSSSIFGATILAVITGLPEISTGYEAIKTKKYNLVFSDIFGGNAFLPVLFFLGTLITGTSTLSFAKNTDIYLTSLGMLLTGIYMIGLIFHSKKQVFWLGIDSWLVLILYVLGMIGLFKLE